MMGKKKRTYYRAAADSLIIVYAAFLLSVYAHTQALVPDEQWFWGLAENEIKWSSWQDLLWTPNYLGYGSIYWMLLKLVGNFFGMRLLCAFFMLLSACLVPYLATRFYQASDRQVFFAVVVYLSCPLVWFTGKIIGPEVVGYSLGIVGCCMGLLGYRNKKWGKYVCAMLLLGVSAGVKLNNVILAVFVLAYVFLDRTGQISKISQWKQLFDRCNFILLIYSGGVFWED